MPDDDSPPPAAPEEPPAPSNVGHAAFTYPAYRYFQLVRLFGVIAAQMQGVAVAWEVYNRTNDALSLGFISLSMFLPSILFSPLTGQTADRFERRYVVMACQVGAAVASLLLWCYAFSGLPQVWPIYCVLFVIGTARAFMAPAAQAMLPELVPTEVFPNAITWNASIFHMATIVGPSVGGLVLWHGGAIYVYALAGILMSVAVLLLSRIKTRTIARERSEIGWEAMLAGLRYAWSNKILLGALTLDMFAVLLGGVETLTPIFARDILQVDRWGLGMLRSAPAVGAVLMGIGIAHLPPMKNAGTMMLKCVAAFGVVTIIFGLSTNFILSMACLILLGMTDMVSVIIRHTLVQTMTPNEMRGRVSAVNAIFINTSNELGGFESGVTARWFGTVPAVIVGGIGTIAVTALWAKLFPQFKAFKTLNTTSEEVEQALREAEKRAAPDAATGPLG